MSDIIVVSWPHGKDTYYGLVTNKSYPRIYGVGNNLDTARSGKRLGVDFVDTLGTNYSLDSLSDYKEITDD